MFHTSTAGAEISDPTNNQIRANGDSVGWPNNPQVEAEVAAWFDAKSLDDEKAIARRLNKAKFGCPLQSVATQDGCSPAEAPCKPRDFLESGKTLNVLGPGRAIIRDRDHICAPPTP
jgi:hypothetical protein